MGAATDPPYHLLFGLLASLLYVLAVMLTKRAADLGVGAWRPALLANLCSAVTFTPLLLLGGTIPGVSSLWQPALVALLFLGGQVWTFYALSRGDVSVATPVLGVKPVMVALLLVIVLGEGVSWQVWAGAILSAAAIGLLNLGPGVSRRNLALTIGGSGLAAACFAMFDVLVQKWSPVWGVGRFLPIMFHLVAGYSLVLLWLLRGRLPAMPEGGARPLWAGAIVMALQAASLVTAIGWFGDAAAMNVVYSSRSLWSVLAVWSVGHWFRNTERELGGRVLAWRLAGAALMMVAIALVLSRG